jgi:hypothetical protein
MQIFIIHCGLTQTDKCTVLPRSLGRVSDYGMDEEGSSSFISRFPPTFHHMHPVCGAHTLSSPLGTITLFPEVNWPELEIDY